MYINDDLIRIEMKGQRIIRTKVKAERPKDKKVHWIQEADCKRKRRKIKINPRRNAGKRLKKKEKGRHGKRVRKM